MVIRLPIVWWRTKDWIHTLFSPDLLRICFHSFCNHRSPVPQPFCPQIALNFDSSLNSQLPLVQQASVPSWAPTILATFPQNLISSSLYSACLCAKLQQPWTVLSSSLGSTSKVSISPWIRCLVLVVSHDRRSSASQIYSISPGSDPLQHPFLIWLQQLGDILQLLAFCPRIPTTSLVHTTFHCSMWAPTTTAHSPSLQKTPFPTYKPSKSFMDRWLMPDGPLHVFAGPQSFFRYTVMPNYLSC